MHVEYTLMQRSIDWGLAMVHQSVGVEPNDDDPGQFVWPVMSKMSTAWFYLPITKKDKALFCCVFRTGLLDAVSGSCTNCYIPSNTGLARTVP